MAPEQWLDGKLAGPSADSYAFGLILAELLTGFHPLLALDQPHTPTEWRQAHLLEHPVLLRQLGAEVFAFQRTRRDADWSARQQVVLTQVEALVARLLAKQVVERPTLETALATLREAAQTLGERPPYTPSDLYPLTTERQQTFWKGLADAYEQFGLHDEALRRIEQARAIAPEEPDVLMSYANILAGKGLVEEALDIYWQALELSPESDHRRRATYLYNIGIQLTTLKRFEKAEEVFTKATMLNPTFADAWLHRAAIAIFRANAALHDGQREVARAQVEAGLAHIEEALRLNPDHYLYRQVNQEILWLWESLQPQG